MLSSRLDPRSSLAVVLLLAALVPARASALVTRQPYLQLVTPTSAVIMWQTDLASSGDSEVLFGTSAALLDHTATALATTTAAEPSLRNHAVLLGGLQPETTYYYAVGTVSGGIEAGGTTDHFVKTGPLRGSRTPFTFMAFGDSGNLSSAQLEVRDAMLPHAGSLALILHLGDMAYDTGTTAQFTARVFGVYAALFRKIPFWPTIGNHEASEGSANSATESGPYYDAFSLPRAGEAGGVASGTEAYYSFDYGQTHFVVLDSDDSSTAPSSPQLQWLARDLAAIPATQQWVITAFHHPPYSKGSHDSDRASDSAGRMVRVRENVAPILEAGGVDLVLGGHSHSYERSYLIDGAYGYGTSPNFATPAFTVLRAGGHILNTGDGVPGSGGSYAKQAGAYPHGGTVYVVSGQGGGQLGGSLGHPVMRYSELRNGFCLVSVSPTMLTLRDVRSDGSVGDEFSLTKPPLCVVAADCDDSDACTTDTCSAGRCTHDALACPEGQACQPASGTCACTALACADADACTTDTCDVAAGCTHATISCDDGDACTTDACSATAGCAHATVVCDDGDACTTDACSAAAGCTHATVSCDDGDVCTTDTCSAAAGCAHATVSCDDGDVCTTDTCSAAAGCAHATVSCDDGDACTTDACESLRGCVAEPQTCPSGHCVAGTCIADPPATAADAAVGSDADASTDAAALPTAGTNGAGGSGDADGRDAAMSMDSGAQTDASVPTDAASDGAPSDPSSPDAQSPDAADNADGGHDAGMPRAPSGGCHALPGDRPGAPGAAFAAALLLGVFTARGRRRRVESRFPGSCSPPNVPLPVPLPLPLPLPE